MAETAYYKFPLYDPEDAPDLTASGEEAQAIEAIDTALHAEHLERVAADEAEAEARESADTELSKEIAREASERKEADEAEAEARRAADTALGERIDAEADTRATEYELLKGKLETEAETRETADKELGGRITQEGLARETADNAEAAERVAADTALGARIDAEAEARQEQDAVLGTEVTGLNSSVNGIMGLNYGADNDPLVKVEEGAYSSPALEKIAQQFEESGGSGFYVINLSRGTTHTYKYTADDIEALKTSPANVVFLIPGYSGAKYRHSVALFCSNSYVSGDTFEGEYYPPNYEYEPYNSFITMYEITVNSPAVGDKITINTYTRTMATTSSQFGLVKVGSGISVTDGVISVASSLTTNSVKALRVDRVDQEETLSLSEKISGKFIGAFCRGSLDTGCYLYGCAQNDDDMALIYLRGLEPDTNYLTGCSLIIDNTGSTSALSMTNPFRCTSYGETTSVSSASHLSDVTILYIPD